MPRTCARRRLGWLVPLAALTACSEPRFEFRGYTEFSGCQRIIDTEIANGARFEGGYASTDSENPGYVTELSGELWGERVDIEVLCSDTGLPGFVHYFPYASDAKETAALWDRFGVELYALFGEPTMVSSDINRSLRFLCHNPSPILLDEWRLVDAETETEAEEDVPHEIYLAVVPRAAECLEDSRR